MVLEVQVLGGGGLPEPEDLATKGDTAIEPIVIMDYSTYACLLVSNGLA